MDKFKLLFEHVNPVKPNLQSQTPFNWQVPLFWQDKFPLARQSISFKKENNYS